MLFLLVLYVTTKSAATKITVKACTEQILMSVICLSCCKPFDRVLVTNLFMISLLFISQGINDTTSAIYSLHSCLSRVGVVTSTSAKSCISDKAKILWHHPSLEIH